ncbi:hypothetical protein EXIGLDRAFT_775904 [Exidia glandulosa HHB12029]|uniref:C2H2-type domain-containing protein n=1 Tax=Exidia glandulosa HHB12029 TaxID=1314781 RepID=A0A165DPX4_EXIGL|nr:hypothetical protein EXIGLDRAFT_775904 [Exidia glandulosa HHB12029]
MAKEQVARHATRIIRLKARVVKHGGVNTPSVPSSPTSVHARLGDPLNDGTPADLPSAQPQPKTTTNCIGCGEMEGLWQHVAELKQEIFELRTQLDYLREEFDLLVWRGDTDEECELSCPHCYEQLPGRFALEEHVIMHGEDITELHRCSRCGRRFALHEDAQSHRFMCTFERETPPAMSSTYTPHTNQSPLDVSSAAALHTPPIAIPFGRPGSSGSRSGRFPPPKRSRVDSSGSMRSMQSWHSAAMIFPCIPANETAVGASRSGASPASAQAGSVMSTGILADSRFRPLHRTTSLPGSRSASIAAFAPVAVDGSTSSDSLPIPSATYPILNQVGSSSPATYRQISSRADTSDVYDPSGFDMSSLAKVDDFRVSTNASNPTDSQAPATTPATLETILAYASLLGAHQPLDIQAQSTTEAAPGNWTEDLDVAMSNWFTAADDSVMSLGGGSDPHTLREGVMAFSS